MRYEGIPAAEVRDLAERALARGALLDDENSDGLSYYLAAGALAFAGDLQMAEAALTAAVEDAQSRGSVLGFATASHAARHDDSDAGTAAGRRRSTPATRSRWSVTGGASAWAARASVLAQTLIERGDLEAAQRHLEAAEAATGEGDPFRLSLLSARGRLKLLSGDAEAALEYFLACGALADRAGVVNPAVAPWRSGCRAGDRGRWATGPRPSG